MSTIRTFAFLLVLTAILGDVIAINTIPDNFMQTGALGDCGNTISRHEDVYVRSHTGAYQLGTLVQYGANENCHISFDAGTGMKVLIKFLNFELESKTGDDCLDVLKLYDLTTGSHEQTVQTTTTNCTAENDTINPANCTGDNCTASETTSPANCTGENCTVSNTTSSENCSVANCTGDNCTVSSNCSMSCVEVNVTTTQTLPADLVVCGSTAPTPFVSQSSKVRFEFSTNGNAEFAGFKLLVTAFRESANCSTGEFQCDTNRCIDSGLKCDTVEHCVDGTDEDDGIAGCTVLDKVAGYIFSLGNMAVIAIAVIGGAIIFTIMTTVIIYHACCKKNRNSVSPIRISQSDPHTTTENKGAKKGTKGKKSVTVVAPSSDDATPSSNKKAWDKKSKKKTEESDDLW